MACVRFASERRGPGALIATKTGPERPQERSATPCRSPDLPLDASKAAHGRPCLRFVARPLLPARLVAELGDGAACCELVPCVVRRHGGRLPIARFLQFDQTGAGGCE